MKSVILTTLMLLSAIPAFAGRESGGGDEYTLDFVRVATQLIYPWLVINGSKLNPPVDSADFLLAVNPKNLISIDHVFESCDGTNQGREVDACYNAASGITYLSRTRYQLKSDSIAKLGLVSHEIFRKMGIEGDGYEISRQMSILVNGDMCGPALDALKRIYTDLCPSIPNDQLQNQCGNSFYALTDEWKRGVGKNCMGQNAINACIEACTPRMGLQCLTYCHF